MSTQLSAKPSSVTAMTCARSPIPGLWVGSAAIGALLLLPLFVDVIADGSPLRGLLLAAVMTAVSSATPGATSG
jgi:hypothetical protein